MHCKSRSPVCRPRRACAKPDRRSPFEGRRVPPVPGRAPCSSRNVRPPFDESLAPALRRGARVPDAALRRRGARLPAHGSRRCAVARQGSAARYPGRANAGGSRCPRETRSAAQSHAAQRDRPRHRVARTARGARQAARRHDLARGAAQRRHAADHAARRWPRHRCRGGPLSRRRAEISRMPKPPPRCATPSCSISSSCPDSP